MPLVVLCAGLAGWLVCFFSPLSDSKYGVAVPAVGLVAVSFLAARHAVEGWRGAVALAAGAVCGGVLGLVLSGPDTALAAVAGVSTLAVVPWSVGRYRRRHAELLGVAWDRAEELERDVELARARERARLAAEMHDLVGHELARAALHVGALEVAPTLPEEHRAAAREARAGVTAAAERLADVVRLLRSDSAPVSSVADVVSRARRDGLAVELVRDDSAGLDPVIARTVHRVVTEALTNVIKHAPRAAVTVAVARADGVSVRVANGPARVAAATGGGQGLLGLAERVALVGGRFSARASDGGFEVVAHLPERPVTATTSTYRQHAERRVRRSARRAVVVAVGVGVGVLASMLGYLVFDAASSTLRSAVFDGLRVGQPETEIVEVLPMRTRIDSVSGCRHYSTDPNPFDRDLYRLCFAGGRLAGKDVVRR
ncbi:histidine kinase [Actinosynnema sp. CS-041913]|uniref:histidine kinase n=1 Tax=Actinosynnema sp. CS-041913 TaxID=3239917 RepID=UPI003D8DBCB0